LLAGAARGTCAFVVQERRSPEPTLPLELFRVRVIAVSIVGSAILGTILFCVSAYVPVFTQGVLGGTAIDAGMTLVPLSLGWPVAATLAGWLLYKYGYRPFAVLGAALAAAGCFLLAAADASSGVRPVMVAMLLVGLGLGFMSTPYLLAVQNAVPWNRRGVATGSVQFFRTIGGAIAVAALGAVLNAHLRAGVGAGVDVNVALHPQARTQVPPAVLGDVVRALEGGLGSIYLVMAVIAVAGVGVALLFPAGSAEAHAHAEARGPAGPTPPTAPPPGSPV